MNKLTKKQTLFLIIGVALVVSLLTYEFIVMKQVEEEKRIEQLTYDEHKKNIDEKNKSITPKFDEVEVDMTKSKVLELVGEPYEIDVYGDNGEFETWFYESDMIYFLYGKVQF